MGVHDGAETLDCRHIDEAFHCLSRLGLQRRVWWKRPQFKVTLAAILAGVGLAAPDFAPVMVEAHQIKPTIYAVCIIAAVLSIWLYAWAWFQDRL